MKDFLLGFSAHLATLAAKDFWDQIGGIGAIFGLLLPVFGFVAWLVKRGQRKSIVELNEKIELLTEDSKNLLMQKNQLAAELVQKNQTIFELEGESPNGFRTTIARELRENNYGKVAANSKTYVDSNFAAMSDAYYWLSKEKWWIVLGFSTSIAHPDDEISKDDECNLIEELINDAVDLAALASKIRSHPIFNRWLIEILQIQATVRTAKFQT